MSSQSPGLILSTHPKLPGIWLIVLPAAAAFQISFFSWTVDDAYISLRYAENLAAGLGLVFNPGERVEGFSNPLWVFIIALLVRCGLSAVVAAKSLGIASFYVLLLYCRRIFHLAMNGTSYANFYGGLAPLCLTFGGTLPYYSVAGLETTFFAALILAGLFYLLRGLLSRDGYSDYLRSGLLLALASVTRPEGVLFVLLAAIFLVVHMRRRLALAVKAIALAAAPGLLISIAYLAFRSSYFGSYLPNTYYAKSFGPAQLLHAGISGSNHQWEALQYGLRYISRFLGLGGGLFAVFSLFLPWRSSPLKKRLGLAVGLLLSFVLGYVLLFILPVGGDWMILHRFIAPVDASLFLAGALALCAAVHYGRKALLWHRSAIVLSALLCTAMAIGTWYEMKYYTVISNRVTTQQQVGIWLREHVPPTATIIVNEAGAIPYYSRLCTIDTAGLTDPRLARLFFEKRDFVERWISTLMDRQADYVLIPALAPLRPGMENTPDPPQGPKLFDEELFRLLFRDRRFQTQYLYERDFFDIGDPRTLFRRRNLN